MYFRSSRCGLCLILGVAANAAWAAEPNAAPIPPTAAAPAQADLARPGQAEPGLLAQPPEAPQPPDAAEPFAPKGSINAGFSFESATAGYQNWHHQFVRGTYTSDPRNTWNWEVVNMREFGDRGVLFVGGNTHVINDDWYVSTFLNTSSGGFFLPRYRADVTVNRKFLQARNLVLGLGLSAIKAKDYHRDTAVLLQAAYYLESPLVIEGNVRITNSNPGSVRTSYYTVAATYGRDKERYVSLSYAQGREGYQLVSDTAAGIGALANFPSRTALFTWREWVGRDWGFQVRVGNYISPYYHRLGGEFGLFLDF